MVKVTRRDKLNLGRRLKNYNDQEPHALSSINVPKDIKGTLRQHHKSTGPPQTRSRAAVAEPLNSPEIKTKGRGTPVDPLISPDTW